MPTTQLLSVKKLELDLSNFRTIPQPNEASAISALISINAEWFWALTESLITDGYYPTENILVLQKNAKYEVKEGNRRIAALKIIHGFAERDTLNIPAHIEEKIENITSDWKKSNLHVPCAVYQKEEADVVDRIVQLTHGKGEKAGRYRWGAVPRARHNRNQGGRAEPGLDLLEKYLMAGRNITNFQRERWAGEYNLSVLDEAIKRLAPRIGEASAPSLAAHYPKIKYRDAIEAILHDIGVEYIGFKDVRNADFGVKYGIPVATPAYETPTPTDSGGKPAKTKPASGNAIHDKPKAVPINDPRAVSRALRKFSPVGKHREKVVTLLEEARNLKVDKFPHAFCFLLRSMFELSAKAYCEEHKQNNGPSYFKRDGAERKLVEVLKDITKHLTENHNDKAMVKALHGAITELARPDGLLSVTSLNQLIHHPTFIVDGKHISTVFANVFPLLEAMNSGA